MNLEYKWKFWLIPLILIVILGFIVSKNILNKRSIQPPEVHIQTVKVKAAEKVKKEDILEYTGSIEAFDEALISARVPGRVSRVLADNGGAVVAGQPLVMLEDQDYIIGLAASEAALKKAEVNLAGMRANFKRMQELYDSKVVSRKDFEDAENGLKAAEADAEAAASGVAAAREALRNATIVSPISGFVAGRSVTTGQVLSPGEPLMTVQDISNVYMVIHVEQKNLARVKTGQKAEATVDAFGDLKFAGHVEIINPAADKSARVFETKIRLSNPGHLLKPGMYAGVEIRSGEAEEVLVVPQNAVISVEGLYFVFIAEGDLARRQQVEIGRVIDQSVEIKSGITEGQLVIVSNVNKLKDQDRITFADSQQQEA